MDGFLKAPKVAKVLGDKKGREHCETESEFVLHRIDSFMGLMKKNPSLVKIFTAVSQ